MNSPTLLRIAYIADSNVPSRTANSIHVMKMCQAYARLGCDVRLVLPKWNHGHEPEVTDVFSFYGIETQFALKRVPLNLKLLNFLHRGIFMPYAASRPLPEFIHSRSMSAAFGSMEFFGIPTILELHDVPRNTPRQEKLFRRILHHDKFLSLVVITKALAERMQPMIHDSKKMMILPDGVDRKSLEAEQTKDDARREIGLDQDVRRIAVYTGHLYRGRGIELMIQLAKKLPDHLFIIVRGQEKNLVDYRSQTSELPNIRFFGFRPPAQIPVFLQAADVLLMPYGQYVEVRRGGKGADTSGHASPIKMFEYMAAGRPILSSNLPVLQEILTDRVNALLLPTDDADAWTNALKTLQQDSQLSASIAQRAKRDAEQYTWERRAEKIVAIASPRTYASMAL